MKFLPRKLSSSLNKSLRSMWISFKSQIRNSRKWHFLFIQKIKPVFFGSSRIIWLHNGSNPKMEWNFLFENDEKEKRAIKLLRFYLRQEFVLVRCQYIHNHYKLVLGITLSKNGLLWFSFSRKQSILQNKDFKDIWIKYTASLSFL